MCTIAKLVGELSQTNSLGVKIPTQSTKSHGAKVCQVCSSTNSALLWRRLGLNRHASASMQVGFQLLTNLTRRTSQDCPTGKSWPLDWPLQDLGVESGQGHCWWLPVPGSCRGSWSNRLSDILARGLLDPWPATWLVVTMTRTQLAVVFTQSQIRLSPFKMIRLQDNSTLERTKQWREKIAMNLLQSIIKRHQ